MQRQAAAAAAAAAAESRASEAAADMARRVRAVTAEFLAEMRKLDNRWSRDVGNGQTGWILVEYRGADYDISERWGIALLTDGTWLRTSPAKVLVIEDPATFFMGGELFSYPSGASIALSGLRSRREHRMTLMMEPVDRAGLGLPHRPLLLYGVDRATLESPAALAAHYFAALLARFTAELPPPPPPPEPAPYRPAPSERRASWRRRSRS